MMLYFHYFYFTFSYSKVSCLIWDLICVRLKSWIDFWHKLIRELAKSICKHFCPKSTLLRSVMAVYPDWQVSNMV